MKCYSRRPVVYPLSSIVQKHFQKAVDSLEAATLYIVATPIGNLADITLRALATLSKADLICAEDTRVTAQLLSAYGITAKLLSVREQNEQQMAGKVIDALAEGKVVAQVSDAGSPAVCDPGAKLSARVREAGYAVVPVCGPSAVITALSAAGISEPEFYFAGFLPSKSKERETLLSSWAQNTHAIVCFETPHRIEDTLAQMVALFPERHITLARELTKTYETFLSGSAQEVQAIVQSDSNQSRGEMVLILHPAAKIQDEGLSTQAQWLMSELIEDMPLKKAAQLVNKITGENKKLAYDFGLSLKK